MRTPISTPACSTRAGSTGLPASPAITAGSIRGPATSACSRLPRGVGPYGIAVTPKGEVWYASLAGNHVARIDLATGTGDCGRTTNAEAGLAADMVGFQKPPLGQRMEQRQRLAARSRRRLLEGLEAAGQQPPRLCRLCRRQGQGLAHRFLRQCDRALRSRKREIQRLRQRQGRAPTCANSTDVRARSGAPSPAPIASS